MSEKLGLIFLAGGANDSIRALMVDYGNALQESGVSIVQIDLQHQAEMQAGIDLMQTGNVAFVLTWLGIGQNIAVNRQDSAKPVNVFETLSVPLIKLQGDLPAYFPDRHRDEPITCGNMYQAAEFVHFKERWLPQYRAPTALIPPMPMVPIARATIDPRGRRNGKLVFLKNGNSPEALRALWRAQLPTSLSELALAMSESISAIGLRAGRLDIGDFVATFLCTHSVLAAATPHLVLFFSAQMDDYLRRIKSTMIAEAILDLPVIVQGSFWSHVDFAGKRAQLIAGEDADTSQKALAHQLGVIDMSANVDGWPHDRVQRAAGAYSLVLTNRQGWLSRQCPEFDDLTFTFEAESIQTRVADALAHPDRYVDRAVEFGERFREIYSREAFAQAVLRLADVARLLGSEQRPRFQDFYVWPSRTS